MSATDWFHKAVIYQVFLDRFNGFKKKTNVPEFLGGNIKGVLRKLDYFESLGINVIWLSPFYESLNYHGYHITDFKKVDPHFGTEEDLRNLMDEAHKRGLYIIADFVPNHCSHEHPFFKDACQNRHSKYSDWFVFDHWPDTYRCFLDFGELPKLNLDNDEAREYMIDVADHWMSMGLDGFRIDHAIGPSHRFWKRFRKSMKARYPHGVFIGEVWCEGLDKKLIKTTGLKHKTLKRKFGISQDKIQLEYDRELDGVLDFALRNMIVEAAGKGVGLLSDNSLKTQIGKHLRKVPPGYFMVAFLDNHDVDRFLLYCKGDVKVLLQAFELLFSLDLPVVLYYGTENCRYNKIPVSGSIPHSDLAVREPFDWNAVHGEFVEGFKGLVAKYRNR